MTKKAARALLALILALGAGAIGYLTGGSGLKPSSASSIPAQTIAAPAEGTVRVVYSLDAKQNDRELIALIDAAKTYAYFAIYEFTLKDVADALVAAKQRGVDVRGLVDSGESANSYNAPIMKELVEAGIPVVTEKHASGNGIMHIKALVTESAYVIGSYNWTKSATTINDEILEIGTDPSLVEVYTNILKKLLTKYKNNPVSAAPGGAANVSEGSTGTYAYTDAAKHVGEYANVTGTLVEVYTSKTGTIFLDFCASYKTCPFSGVIFADDAANFGDLKKYKGKKVTLSGKISLYEGRAEIILNDRDQLK